MPDERKEKEMQDVFGPVRFRDLFKYFRRGLVDESFRLVVSWARNRREKTTKTKATNRRNDRKMADGRYKNHIIKQGNHNRSYIEILSCQLSRYCRFCSP